MKKSRSFSEGHIDIRRPMPRIVSNLQSLLLDEVGTPPVESPPVESPPPPVSPPPVESVPTEQLSPQTHYSWPLFLLRWSLRFAVHLSLVSLFETLFFWLFVSRTEDAALISLVNSYSKGLLNQCSSMNGTQRALFMEFVNILVNQTQVQMRGAAAGADRAAFNGNLLTTSWIYVGSLGALTGSLVGSAVYSHAPIQWRQLGLENLALILILGIYEFMFFRTVVYPYQAISMPELDRMLMNEIDASCDPASAVAASSASAGF